METVKSILGAGIDFVGWVATLNQWGKTTVACVGVVGFISLCLLAAVILGGGWQRNHTKEEHDEEGAQ